MAILLRITILKSCSSYSNTQTLRKCQFIRTTLSVNKTKSSCDRSLIGVNSDFVMTLATTLSHVLLFVIEHHFRSVSH